MSANTGFLITARLKSTRLPKKLLLKINGDEMIRHMITHLKSSDVLDRVIICTSTNPQDAPLIDIAVDEGIDYFAGDERDVIARLYEASRAFDLDYALNITADCPLVSLEYIKEIIKKYHETNADFIRCLDLPHGFFSYGLKIDAMQKVCEMKKSSETEVWGRYFTDTGTFNVVDIDVPRKLVRKNYRLTLDYEEDFVFFKKLFEHFGENIHTASIAEIIKYLDENPDIVGINAHCAELYRKRWDLQNIIEV